MRMFAALFVFLLLVEQGSHAWSPIHTRLRYGCILLLDERHRKGLHGPRSLGFLVDDKDLDERPFYADLESPSDDRVERMAAFLSVRLGALVIKQLAQKRRNEAALVERNEEKAHVVIAKKPDYPASSPLPPLNRDASRGETKSSSKSSRLSQELKTSKAELLEKRGTNGAAVAERVEVKAPNDTVKKPDSTATSSSSPLNKGAAEDDTRSSFESSRLSQEFKTSKGELLDPFEVLCVERTATTDQVKQAYRRLSRRYHPDVVTHLETLPGRCNNLEDVRDEWERIQLSYSILKSKKMRIRYERNELWSDPTSAAWQGIAHLGNGLLDASFSAVSSLFSEMNEKKDNTAERCT